MTVTSALTWLLASPGYETHGQSHPAVGLIQSFGKKFFFPFGFVKQEVSVSLAVFDVDKGSRTRT